MLPILAVLALQTPAAPAPAPEVWTTAELEKVSKEIQEQVEEMRGVKYRAPVAVKLTDKKGFIEYALQRQKETESPAKLRRDETVGKLLGLIEPSMDLQARMLELLEEQVGGFYDPGTKTFYLMDTFRGGLAKVILSHELTHALDDQYFDLDGHLKSMGEDTDVTIAYQSVVEGSGKRLMDQWVLHNLGSLSRTELEEVTKMGAEQMAKAPPYLWKPLLAVYMKGDTFLSKGDAMMRNGLKVAGNDPPAKDGYIRAAFQDPPVSSEQVLHPEKYWAMNPRDLPVRVAISTEHLPQGWTVLGSDTLGELYLGLLTTPIADRKGLDTTNMLAMLSIKYTTPAAEGWGGDRLVVLGRGDDRVLVMVTAWDTEKDAAEFAAALTTSSAMAAPATSNAEAAPAGDAPATEPAKAPVLTTFGANPRDKEHGFVPGMTPPDVIVSRSTVPGESNVVIVRVGSFTRAGDTDSRLDSISLPYTIEHAKK